jgi:hypothetical protein
LNVGMAAVEKKCSSTVMRGGRDMVVNVIELDKRKDV